MSCRFDRKPGNSYIYVEFPGFLIRRNQEGCEKRGLFRGHAWRKCYYFVYKKFTYQLGKNPVFSITMVRKVPSPSSVSRQPWFRRAMRRAL